MVPKLFLISNVLVTLLIIGQKAQADQTEVVFWQTIAKSKDGEEYCAYLAAYPDGKFFQLANIRAKKLGGSCLPSKKVADKKTNTTEPPVLTAKKTGDLQGKQSFFASENYFKGKMAFDSKNYKVALRLWTQSANEGYPEAQGLIGGMFAGGFGVQKDFKIAMEWYQKAARKGVAQAQLGIGNLYGDGLGVKQDYIRARMWFAISANRGNERAEFNLKKITERMATDDIKKSEQMALAWMKRHNQL